MGPRMLTSSAILLLAISVRSQPSPLDTLTAHLFKDYNSNVAPFVNRRNSTSELRVSISLAHAIIDTMNERDWTVSIMTTRWTDERLRWDPSIYDEITEIAVKSSAVWQPDVYPCVSSTSTTVLPEANSAMIRFTGELFLDVFQIITYSCPMNFDSFPFDVQHCQICFALEGITGTAVDLIDVSPKTPDLLGNSEWHFVGNFSTGERRSESEGVQTDRVVYRFSVARSPYFWVALIIVPTCLLCILALFGIFFSSDGKLVDNAVTIGLTTMTSLMLVVTILADSLAKADNLPGLGWFVLYDIGIVCVAAITALVLDHSRSLAISNSKKARKTSSCITLLLSKRTYRCIRVILFVLSIVGLALNVALRWSSASWNVPVEDPRFADSRG